MSLALTPVQACLNRINAGDSEAREDLYRVCSARLRFLTQTIFNDFSRLRRWENSDDILNAALLKLDRSLRETKPETTKAFLGLAALQIRRVLLDLIDHYYGPGGIGRHESIPLGSIDVPQSTDQERDFDIWTSFHQKVETLSDDEREVVDLHWYLDLTLEEVAQQLDISLSTVKRRWVNARDKLADILINDDFAT